MSSSRVRISGRVTAPLAQPAARVVVRAGSACQAHFTFRGTVVARGIRLGPNGRWAATITLPPALRGARIFMRAETRVRATAGNPKLFPTFTLIEGVNLK